MLNRGRRYFPLQAFDIGRDMDRAYLGERGDPVISAPGGKFARRARVGLPGVRVSDLCREELYRPLGGPGVRGKERQ